MAQPCQEVGIRCKDTAPFPLSQLLFGNQLLRIGPSALSLLSAQWLAVGSLPSAATVIGSSLAPTWGCPLVSMATLPCKHEGGSFYEIIKPNFAVWVPNHSRDPGSWRTLPGGRRTSPDPTQELDQVTYRTPPNAHHELQPFLALKGLPHPVSPSYSPTCPLSLSLHPVLCPSWPLQPQVRPPWSLGLHPCWSHSPIRSLRLHPAPPAHWLPACPHAQPHWVPVPGEHPMPACLWHVW